MKKLSLLLVLFLVACKAVGPDYKRAEPNLPAAFSESDTNANTSNDVMKQWWKHYQDEKLNELVELTLKNLSLIHIFGHSVSIHACYAALRRLGGYRFDACQHQSC